MVTPAVPVTAALSRWQIIVAPLLTGALVAAPWLDFSFFPVAWVAFAPLLWALGRATSRREALRLGLLAGLATNVPAFYWLVYTIHVFGGFPYVLAVFFYTCLSLFSAMQFVFFAWGFHRLRFGPLGLFAPVLWVALEFLFPNLFPWRMGNSQLEMPVLMQTGDLAGPYLLSFVMVWVSAGIALAAGTRHRLVPLAAAATAAAALLGYGLWRMPIVQAAIDAAPTVRVGLVQGNVGIHEKGNVSLFDVNLEHYRELSAPLQSQVDVLIWPESVAQWWTEVGDDHVSDKHNPYSGRRRTSSTAASRSSIRGGRRGVDVQQRLPDQRRRSRLRPLRQAGADPVRRVHPVRLAGAERLRPQPADEPLHSREGARTAAGPGPPADRAADLLRGRPGEHRARDDRRRRRGAADDLQRRVVRPLDGAYQHEAIALWRANREPPLLRARRQRRRDRRHRSVWPRPRPPRYVHRRDAARQHPAAADRDGVHPHRRHFAWGVVAVAGRVARPRPLEGAVDGATAVHRDLCALRGDRRTSANAATAVTLAMANAVKTGV
jgi:hypothetical protein